MLRKLSAKHNQVNTIWKEKKKTVQTTECPKNVNIVCFMTGTAIFNRLGVTAT